MLPRVYGIILAGLAGSLALLLILEMVPVLLFAPGVDILMLLGTFIAGGNAALGIGAILFLGAGLSSAAVYAGLWQVGIGRPSPGIGLLFGLGHGLASIVVLQILYALNPDPPTLYMTAIKCLSVLLGHLAYGLVVASVYRPFAPSPSRSHQRAMDSAS